MSSNNDNQSILIRCKNCTNEILWINNQLYEICNRQLIENNNDRNLEVNRIATRRRERALLIENRGWIYQEKHNQMMRVFYINPNRIGTESFEKVELLKKQIREQQFDVYLLSSPDRK